MRKGSRSMSKLFSVVIACLAATSIMSPSHASAATERPPEFTLWYDKPAAKWEEALPVGNGVLGAMVFGGVASERFQLNTNSLWSGGEQDADNPAALQALPKIRELLFAGKYAEAQELTNRTQVCIGKGDKGSFGSYSTLGDLHLTFDDHADHPTDYVRELRLDDAIARTTYRLNGVTFTRETFSTYRDDVLVTRITADRPGKISFAPRSRAGARESRCPRRARSAHVRPARQRRPTRHEVRGTNADHRQRRQHLARGRGGQRRRGRGRRAARRASVAVRIRSSSSSPPARTTTTTHFTAPSPIASTVPLPTPGTRC